MKHDIVSRISKTENLIEELNKKLDEGKKEFTEFVIDKEISLDIRWKLWSAAPNALKNHEPYIHHFNFEKVHDSIFIDPDYYERYETIHLYSYISDIEDNLRSALANPEEKIASKFLKESPFKTHKIIEELKEEILEKNLGSFIFDW